MYLDFCPWYLLARGIVIMFLIAMFFGALYIFTNVIKSKDTICDSEKQSKFIIECIKADTTKDFRVIGACEQMSLILYCK